jgi:hypothetical protein
MSAQLFDLAAQIGSRCLATDAPSFTRLEPLALGLDHGRRRAEPS